MVFDFDFSVDLGGGGGGSFTDPDLPPGINRGDLVGAITVTTAPTLAGTVAVKLVAPTPTRLSAIGAPVANYEAEFHDYTYRWYIEGAPLAAHSAPQNMRTEWNNPNQAFGKTAGFVVPHRAAAYTFRLIASDDSKDYELGSVTVQTVTADSAYPTTQTICFATTDFVGAPAGAQQVATVAALETAIQAATLPTRVLFRRG